MSSLVLGIAPAAGWFMYTPLSNAVYSPGPNADFWLLGITFVEISAVSAGGKLVVSILRSRTSGMGLLHMPLYCWYILVMALMIVFGFPPLILGSILLELERSAGMPFFDVARGGDSILWLHLFWLFGHPEVYIIFLPAAGIVSTLLPVFARRPIVAYQWIVLAVIATGFISFGLWVHHMFTIGIPKLAQAFFSMASMLVAIPTGIQIFAWLATLWTGRPDLQATIVEGRHTLPEIEHGRRETWGSDAVTGRVRDIIHLPGNSWLPFYAALALSVLCISLLIRTYSLALVAVGVSLVLLLRWSWVNGAHPGAAPDAEVMPGYPPLHSRTFDSPGMVVTLLADGALYLSLLFGWLYLWTVAPHWQVPETAPLSWMPLLISGGLLTAAVIWYIRVVQQLREGLDSHLQSRLWGISLLGLVHSGILIWAWANSTLVPTQTAHNAVIAVMLMYQLFHSGLAVMMTALQAWRVAYGYVGKAAPYELVVVEPWWFYTVVVFWVSFVAIVLLPIAWGGA